MFSIVHHEGREIVEAVREEVQRLADLTDLSDIVAVSGSGQQHATVYLSEKGVTALEALDPARPLVRQFDGCFARASPVPPSQACSSANSPKTSQDIHQRVSNGTEKPFFCGPEATYPRLSNIHKRDLDTKLSLNAEMRILRVELPHSDGKSVLFFRRIPIIRFL